MKASGKFNEYSKEELLRICLEQEDELGKLRPKPAKFKLGQVVAHLKAPGQYRGQPAYFRTLAVEFRNGTWWYGYAQSGQRFLTYPEDVLRSMTQAEIEGGSDPQVAATIAGQQLQEVLQQAQAGHPAAGHWTVVDDEL